jgi:hypothetical protein
MQSAGQQPRQRGQNALKEYKMSLMADAAENAIEQNGRTQTPRMTIQVVDNQPRLTVYTNVKDDANKGIIEGNMDTYTFAAMLQAVRDVANDPANPGIRIPNKGYFFKGGERSEKPGVKSTTVVGRDSDGNVYIALIANNRPNIRFKFLPSEWHDGIMDAKGNVLSTAMVSKMYAVGYANVVEKLVAQILVTEHTTPDEIKARKEANKANFGKGNRPGGGGGYNGGGSGFKRDGNSNYRNNNSGGGGGSAPAAEADFDEDIAW